MNEQPYQTGTSGDDTPYTLRELYGEFLDGLRGRSVSNLKNYNIRTRIFLETYGHRDPRDIKRSDINKWYESLVDSEKYRPVTLSGYRQSMKALFSWLVRDGYININVADHLRAGRFITPNVKSRVPNEDNVKKISEIAEQWFTSEIRTERRAACFWFWALESAGRIGGICYLKLKEYLRGRQRPDANGVYQFDTWSKGKEVIFEVTDITIRASNAWLEVRPESDRPELITTIWHHQHPVNRIVTEQGCKAFKRLSVAADIYPYITSKQLRHRAGTILTRDHDPKIAAMKLCHADAQTTAQTAIAYYYQPDRSEVSRVTAMLAGRI